MRYKEVPFEELKGKIITEISGGNSGSEEIIFITNIGNKYKMYHEQSCCEHVSVEEVVGEWNDIIGQEILLAEESGGETKDHVEYGTETWTFYKLSTIKGSLTIRWYGSSNGYYSEKVDFVKMFH